MAATSRSLGSLTLTLLVLPPLVAACGADNAWDADPETDGDADADIDVDADADTDADADGDDGCGAVGFSVEARQPNVLLLFDRSCSMRRRLDVEEIQFGVGPDDPSTRWHAAREAVRTLTERYASRVRFGLMVFPEPREGCGEAPSLNVAPGPGTSDEILAVLHEDGVQPFDLCESEEVQPWETPTIEALQEIIDSGVLTDPDRDDIVLLLTDGGASCDATEDSLQALAESLLASGTRTAVLGFAIDQERALAMLEALAVGGGLARPDGPPSYWLATDPGELDSDLDAIVAAAVSCTFALSETPPNADELYAFVDGEEILRDSADGFTYDAATNTVSFEGAVCERIRSLEVRSINVVFGCPEDICTPSEEVCDGLDNDCDREVDETCPD